MRAIEKHFRNSLSEISFPPSFGRRLGESAVMACGADHVRPDVCWIVLSNFVCGERGKSESEVCVVSVDDDVD